MRNARRAAAPAATDSAESQQPPAPISETPPDGGQPASDSKSTPPPDPATRDSTPSPRPRSRRKTADDAPADTDASVTATVPKPRAQRTRARSVAVEAETAVPVESPDTPEVTLIDPATEPNPERKGRRSSRRHRNTTDESTRDEPAASVEAPTAETDIPEPAPDAVADSESSQPPPVRRRRSRRRLDSTARPETAAEPEAAAEEVAETEPAPKTGRRSRRRRGRSSDADQIIETVDLLSDGLDITETSPELPEEEEDFDLDLMAPPPPIYVAPRLVPAVLPPAEGALLPRSEAHLVAPGQGDRTASLVINGVPHPPYFLFVNAETAPDAEVIASEIRGAASAGVHFFSGVMYLPFKNAYGERSFAGADALLSLILDADPEAWIFPRLQFVPTNYWARTHPDQVAKYADGTTGDVSTASTEFWADCVDALEALIAHFADPATKGGDRVVGLHLDRGEWFHDASAGCDQSLPNKFAFQNWLRAKYQFVYALRAAWFDASVTFDDAEIPDLTVHQHSQQPLYYSNRDGRYSDYCQYASYLMADVIEGLASVVKALSNDRLIVAVSYGYTLEFANRPDSGHLALGTILASPYVDIIAGPNSYSARTAGLTGGFGGPVDSVSLNGKLWLVEDDTKTHLAEAETEDTYNPKIGNPADTYAAHLRHFSAALAHSAGVSWMDLWGQGWLDSPEIWREFGDLCANAAVLNKLSPAATPPDVAFIVDEKSLSLIKHSEHSIGAALVTKARDVLLRSGASIGFYLQSDILNPAFPDCPLNIFACSLQISTAERQAIREKLHRTGKTLLWMYAPGAFDEHGPTEQEVGDVTGIVLRPQPWNTPMGAQLSDIRHVIIDRLRNTPGSHKKAISTDEVLNPSYAACDPQATVLGEYLASGAAALAVREHPAGWKAVFIGEPSLSPELLRGLLQYAGIAVYGSPDDVVYARSNVIAAHGGYTGQRTFSLPDRATIYDATEHRIIGVNTRTFRSFLRAKCTRLFLWGEGDAIAEATGVPLPAVVAPPQRSADPRSRENIEESLIELDAIVESPDNPTGENDAHVDHEDVSFDDAAEQTHDGSDSDRPVDAPAASARRSRWQRRRAAMRARREADRKAQSAEPTAPGQEPSPPIALSELLPDLPPRVKPSV